MAENRPILGFVGTGHMGLPMAGNLLKAGYPLSVYNRTAERLRPLVEAGATSAKKPGDTAQGGIVFTMLSDDAALETVVLDENGLLGRLGKGGVHVSMSTVAPATGRELARRHRAVDEYYLAAPVFGRPDAAAAARLAICLSGESKPKARLRPILDLLATKIVDFGADPGAANVVKLAGNFLIGAAIEAMAEAFALGEKNGVERTQMAELFGQTLFSCPVYQGYGTTIANQRYEPAGFRLRLGHKDMGLALKVASESIMPMPLANLVHERLTASLAKGRQDIDWTGLAIEATEDAGLAARKR